MKDLILYGDCKDTLKQFKCKARTCITSPPYYGLRNYGDESKQIGLEDTPEEYIQNLVDVFREVKKVLRKDSFFPYAVRVLIIFHGKYKFEKKKKTGF